LKREIDGKREEKKKFYIENFRSGKEKKTQAIKNKNP
jgi:hypothetical protein